MRLQGRESDLGHKREDHRFKAGTDGFEPQDTGSNEMTLSTLPGPSAGPTSSLYNRRPKRTRDGYTADSRSCLYLGGRPECFLGVSGLEVGEGAQSMVWGS